MSVKSPTRRILEPLSLVLDVVATVALIGWLNQPDIVMPLVWVVCLVAALCLNLALSISYITEDFDDAGQPDV